MTRRTTYRKKLIHKLGINTRTSSQQKFLQVLFEEWPVIVEGDDSVLLIKVVEDDPEDHEKQCSSLLSREEVTELIEFLQDLVQGSK